MTYRGSRRVRLLLNISAHLVVLGLLFQVAAFDHWHMGFEGVQGVQGSSNHVHASHCHGNVAGCADGGGSALNVLDAASQFAAPLSPLVQTGGPSLTTDRPIDAVLETPSQPPKAV